MLEVLLTIKSIKQPFSPNQELLEIMNIFREMVNQCISIGLDNNCSTLKKLSLLSYHKLEQYNIYSRYKLNAISQACGRLSQMKKDMRKRKNVKSPFIIKPYLVSCYGFKINGMVLSIPITSRNYVNILLNYHTITELSKKVEPRSFTITEISLSISIKRNIHSIQPENTIGIDRNLRNVTISTLTQNIIYKTNKLLSIKENTMRVIAAFRRDDKRVKQKFYAKKKGRSTRRVNQYLHIISKDIVKKAMQINSIIILEDLKGIRKLYRKGNGQGKKYRRRLNTWSFYEVQRQIEYKVKWEGIPVQFVNPRRTSMMCPICGDRIQEDHQKWRKLWCSNCKRSMDRDVVASLNISHKGWTRFIHPRGLPNEIMRKKVDIMNKELIILKIDGSKLVNCKT